MNKVTLIGRLTKDPELKYTAGSGIAVCTFTLAVDRKFKNADGNREADFISIVVWRKPAEVIAERSAKGKLIGISGSIQVRNYDAKDGTKRYVTEVVADDFQIIEWADSGKAPSASSGSENGDDVTPIDDGDIPF